MSKSLKALLKLRVEKAKKVIGKSPSNEGKEPVPVKVIELGRKGIQYRLP